MEKEWVGEEFSICDLRMKNFFTFWKSKKNTPDLSAVTEKQLSKNIEVIKSLQDYDEGEKDISTSNVQKYLPRIRVTS